MSEGFDNAARRLLERAYASKGTWVQVWLPDPTIRQRTRWLGVGIDVDQPDPLPKGGGVNAYTRWARGFLRALYYQHRNNSPYRLGGQWAKRSAPRSTSALRVQVGRHVAASGSWPDGGLPPRRRVRVQLAAGGRAKQRAVARLADRDRIYTDDGRAAARWAGGGKYRDW